MKIFGSIHAQLNNCIVVMIVQHGGVNGFDAFVDLSYVGGA